ncbi:MAG TPA: hypothetical protein VM818_02220 [Vicinamibacterales bacterium]|nr:hypothetical protein [Vicinamibacterales bacterium]
MPEFNVRSDSVNVEQIMEQIRARIREKRGVDYTEQQVRELAAVKLEKFLDPRGVRSDLLSEFRRSGPDPNYAFEDDTLFRSTRGLIQGIRRLLQPVLKLFFNPNPLIHVLHMQSQINDLNASRHQLYYELIHNLVVETTRLGIEVKNLKMRVESLDARVDFSERRARALEGAVMYRPQDDEDGDRDRLRSSERSGPGAVPAAVSAPAVTGATPNSIVGATPVAEGAGQRSRRRRRRRGRRGGAPAALVMGSPGGPAPSQPPGTSETGHGDQPAASASAADAPNPDAEPGPAEDATERGSDVDQ